MGSFTAAGTFAAAIERLPHLATLGITVIELMPVQHFCGDPKGWGYSPCSLSAIKPELGGSLGLKAFVDAAADHGMAVFADTVLNHASSQTLLKDYDGTDSDGHAGPYFFSDSNADANTPWGPRPNYVTVGSRFYLLNATKALVDEFHMSGFRFDSTSCMRQTCTGSSTRQEVPSGWSMLQFLNKHLHAYSNSTPSSLSPPSSSLSPSPTSSSSFSSPTSLSSSLLTFAEDSWGAPVPAIVAAVNNTTAPGGSAMSTGGAGFDAQWSYWWHFSVVHELTKTDADHVNMAMVAQAYQGLPGLLPQGYVVFTENHDTASNQHNGRLPFQADPGAVNLTYVAAKKALLGMAMVLTVPGTPMLLQGQEIFSRAAFDFPVPPPFKWNLVEERASLVSAVARLATLRTNCSGLSGALCGYGARTVFDGQRKIATVMRNYNDGEVGARNDQRRRRRALILLNFRDEAIQSMPIEARSGIFTPQQDDGIWDVVFNGDARMYSSMFQGTCAHQMDIKVTGGAASVCVPRLAALVLVPRN